MSESTPSQREWLIAGASPVEGRDREFRDWYWSEHIPEVLSLPGFVAAYRYCSSAENPPYGYITLYEIEGSAQDALKLLFTSNLGSSDAMDVTKAMAAPFPAGLPVLPV